MEINNVGKPNEVQPISNAKKINKNNEIKSEQSNDRVNFSDDSKMHAIYTKAMDIVKNTPDVRADKIEEAKALLESFKNPSNDILEDVAKKLLKEFGA